MATLPSLCRRIMMDVLEKIVMYEQGELNEEEIIELFQELVDTKVVWSLQGHYGRVANHLIEEGLVNLNGPFN